MRIIVVAVVVVASALFVILLLQTMHLRKTLNTLKTAKLSTDDDDADASAPGGAENYVRTYALRILPNMANDLERRKGSPVIREQMPTSCGVRNVVYNTTVWLVVAKSGSQTNEFAEEVLTERIRYVIIGNSVARIQFVPEDIGMYVFALGKAYDYTMPDKTTCGVPSAMVPFAERSTDVFSDMASAVSSSDSSKSELLLQVWAYGGKK